MWNFGILKAKIHGCVLEDVNILHGCVRLTTKSQSPIPAIESNLYISESQITPPQTGYLARCTTTRQALENSGQLATIGYRDHLSEDAPTCSGLNVSRRKLTAKPTLLSAPAFGDVRLINGHQPEPMDGTTIGSCAFESEGVVGGAGWPSRQHQRRSKMVAPVTGSGAMNWRTVVEPFAKVARHISCQL